MGAKADHVRSLRDRWTPCPVRAVRRRPACGSSVPHGRFAGRGTYGKMIVMKIERTSDGGAVLKRIGASRVVLSNAEASLRAQGSVQ